MRRARWTAPSRRVSRFGLGSASSSRTRGTPTTRSPSRSGIDAATGWYRRRLTLPAELRGRRLFLYFEGANQVADVYVNGRRAGRHVGGYTAFSFDVTDLARFDAPNVIAVRVDNSHDQAIPPLNADFTFYGGIYRDVWLIATDPVHITVTDHASPGIYVDTPAISRAIRDGAGAWHGGQRDLESATRSYREPRRRRRRPRGDASSSPM